MSVADDKRIVVLLKSLRTNNRFYSLVDPTRGLKNADAITEFPDDIILGIAYPCLEDGLNDFAVIRTTFETLDLFADDEELRREMMGIIADARSHLIERLSELRDKIVTGQAHFLGTDLREFHGHLLHMAQKGTIRRQLDSMMKVDVFESVSRAEVLLTGGMAEPMYRYDFLPQHALSRIETLPARKFIGELFEDVLAAVLDDSNYTSKYRFDRFVFQKFIAVMFVNYATTDPMFYGTSRDDYGVSAEKDMQETPLYQSIKVAIRELETGVEFMRDRVTGGIVAAPHAVAEEEDLTSIFSAAAGEDVIPNFQAAGGHSVEIPFGTEGQLQETLTRLADAARILQSLDVPHAGDVKRIVAGAGQQVFRLMQELQIISPLASDPFWELAD